MNWIAFWITILFILVAGMAAQWLVRLWIPFIVWLSSDDSEKFRSLADKTLTVLAVLFAATMMGLLFS